MNDSDTRGNQRTPSDDSSTASPTHATDLTAFQRDLLALLTEDADYGLGLKDHLESYYGEDINHGRLYHNLDQLVERELVEKVALDKRTNEYRPTAEGRAIVRNRAQWLLAKLDLEPATPEAADD